MHETVDLQVSRRTLADAVLDRLRGLILSGELAVGTQLRQDDIAARLGVSRTPLRDAINRLTMEGLVANDPRRGAVVCKPSLDELQETYEIREALEVLAGTLAAQRRTTHDMAELRGICEEFGAVSSVGEWVALNTRFHMRVYEMSGRSQLCALIGQMRNRAEMFVRGLVAAPARSQRAEEDHRRILDALERGDATGVAEEIRTHLRVTVEAVISDAKEQS